VDLARDGLWLALRCGWGVAELRSLLAGRAGAPFLGMYGSVLQEWLAAEGAASATPLRELADGALSTPLVFEALVLGVLGAATATGPGESQTASNFCRNVRCPVCSCVSCPRLLADPERPKLLRIMPDIAPLAQRGNTAQRRGLLELLVAMVTRLPLASMMAAPETLFVRDAACAFLLAATQSTSEGMHRLVLLLTIVLFADCWWNDRA
jgi:hypothetical protein